VRRLRVLIVAALFAAGCSKGIDVPAGTTVRYENRAVSARVDVSEPLAGSIIAALNRHPDSADRHVRAGLDTLKYLHVAQRTLQVMPDSVILLDDRGVRTWRIPDIEIQLDALLPKRPNAPRIRTRDSEEDEWSLAQKEDDGKLMIIRFRSDTPTGVDTKRYPHLVAISWKYHPENEGGMPSSADNERMVLLEGLLEPLETNGRAYLTAVVTCNGVREWQWYTNDPGKMIDAFNAALAGRPPFPITLSQQADPGWSAYFGIRNAAQ